MEGAAPPIRIRCAGLAMLESLLFIVAALLVLVVLTSLALAPVVGMSFYLATNGKLARANVAVGILSSVLGLIVGGLVFDPVARTPPAQAYLIVGVWIGGILGVVIATIARFTNGPREFQLQRSLRSWFVVVSLVCVGCAAVAYVWRLDW